MTTRRFNRGQLAQAIASFFDMQGQVDPDYDETLRSQLTVASLDDSPYLKFAVPVGRLGVAAPVAANFGCVAIRPGDSVALQVLQIEINNDGAAFGQYLIGTMSAADFAASVAVVKQTNVLDLSQSGSIGRPSQIWAGVRGAIAAGTVYRVNVPAQSSVIVSLPRPGAFVQGDDPDGIGGIAVWHRTVNLEVQAGFYGREWPLR